MHERPDPVGTSTSTIERRATLALPERTARSTSTLTGVLANSHTLPATASRLRQVPTEYLCYRMRGIIAQRRTVAGFPGCATGGRLQSGTPGHHLIEHHIQRLLVLTGRFEDIEVLEIGVGVQRELGPDDGDLRGLKRLRSARVVSAGHAFIQNFRRDHYELGVDVHPRYRLSVAFTELALAI